MNINVDRVNFIIHSIWAVIFFTIMSTAAWAQLALPLEQLYADTVVVNGRVYTMDDAGLNANVGTVTEAIAIKHGRVQALGTNAQIQALTGPATRVIDVNGRTVIPGIIDTHSHLDTYSVSRWGDEVMNNESVWDNWRVPVPEFDFRWGVNWEEGWEFSVQAVQEVLSKAVAESEPGEWIVIQMGLNTGLHCRAGYGQARYTKQNMRLNEIAPENPVHVRCGTRPVLNTQAEAKFRALWGDRPMEPGLIDAFADNTGRGSNTTSRILRTEILATPEELAEMLRREMASWASFGSTTWSTSIRSATSVASLKWLDSKGLSPNRAAWGPSLGTLAAGTHEMSANLHGYGTEWVWFNGVSLRGVDGGYPDFNTSVEPPEIAQEIKDREWRKPTSNWINEILAGGHRYTNTHTAGDASLDETLESIERESTRRGMSLDDIRAMRHVVDHCTMNPRPDQIPRLRELGMMVSCSPKRIPNLPPLIAQDYGRPYTKWIAPMRGLINGGVMASIEIDEGEIHNKGYFYYLDMVVNRLSLDGLVYNPEERIDREHALKAATIWAAHYLLREDRLGSLEPGKHADFVVLDKPYFDSASVPDDMIKTVRPLMTVVGDKVSYLDAGLADELGMEPAGHHPEGVINAIAGWEENGWP